MENRRELSRHIGTVFGQKSQLWFHLPAADSFKLLGAIYDIDSPTLEKRTARLRDQFGLGDFFNTPVRRLSLGQRIRCEVAASLIHEPELLFLDEPTIGLDVVVKRELRERILEMNREKGVTVFLTSHDAGDIENICQRAVVIDGGGIVLDESVEGLRTKHMTGKKLTVRYAGEYCAAGMGQAFFLRPGLRRLRNRHPAHRRGGGTGTFAFSGQRDGHFRGGPHHGADHRLHFRKGACLTCGNTG